jgi:CheY-like chemotaxis protein
VEPLRIVVADNDPSVLELVCTDLSLEGHAVVATAPSGEAALEACRVHHPDVLIVDYRMPPGWDGLETIRQVRKEGAAQTCILYSNYRSPRIAAETIRVGGIYVKKGPLRTLRAALPKPRSEPSS